MKRNPALNWLVPLIAGLAITIASVGLFSQGGDGSFSFSTVYGDTVEIYGQGIYRHDTSFVAALSNGTDAIALFVGLPLLLIGYMSYRRGSLRGSLFLIGMLLYFLYIGATYTFSVLFNSMFLIYTALFSASLFATIIALTDFDIQYLASKVTSNIPRRGIAIFMFVAGLGTLMLWLSELIAPIMTGQAPVNLGHYTTMFTHGFDSAVITPACVITGIYLLKRKPLGYLLAAPLLILCTIIGVTVIAQTTSQTLAGFVFPIGVYIGMIGSWVVMGAFAVGLAISFFRNISETTQH
ncbi:hypothetical protein [Candidatus Villigracilis affinis]|uniref:hypothetical protein n=1 Tax=Candidatus Villigracilis affinis TaxID=3140682 RepID=UPI002A200ED1|nr:hypothetical protein [Anaerolineales bacterium]